MAARGNPVREKKGLGGDPEWRLRSVAKKGQFTPFSLFSFLSLMTISSFCFSWSWNRLYIFGPKCFSFREAVLIFFDYENMEYGLSEDR